MIPVRQRSVVGALAAVALSACGPASPGADSGRASETTGAERGYSAPPTATFSERLGGGRILVSGTAAPFARVRLASPAGIAAFAKTDGQGIWRLTLPPAEDARLFGLSMLRPGRPVQAEGYLAITPSGRVAQLRAGSGAIALQKVGSGVATLAADFDRKGAAVISGEAPPGAQVVVRVDGARRGPVRADAAGRFMLALNEPLSTGNHIVGAVAVGAEDQTPLMVSPAEPLNAGPFHAQPVAEGWRIDWQTPGGGVQTTVLFGPPGPTP